MQAWSLRLDQTAPGIEASLSDQIAEEVARRGFRTHFNVDITGGSGLVRRFDLAVGEGGRGLLKTADTDSISYFQRAAELYIVSANDIRRVRRDTAHAYVWNQERLAEPNPLVIEELLAADVHPVSTVEAATDALVPDTATFPQ